MVAKPFPVFAPDKASRTLNAPAPLSVGLVLLSGGLDSVAALHWTLSQQHDVVATISFAYGQPYPELVAAGVIAKRRAAASYTCVIGHAVRGEVPLPMPAPGLKSPGVSNANLPGRNGVLLAIAAAHAGRSWPGAHVRLVMGANLDDAAGFPDCHPEFFETQRRALSYGLTGVCNIAWIDTPWIKMRKVDILRWCVDAGDAAMTDIRTSMSCYAGTRCGTCDPCRLRRSAFDALGLVDFIEDIPSCGGDPAREAALRR